MTEREKIANILNSTEISQELSKEDIYKFADALIAAGIGDVLEEKSKAFVYANEIAYLDNQLKEYKHRAEVAERALLTACVNLIKNEKANVNNVNMELLVRVVYTNYLRKAEKELAEGKKE